MADGPAPLAPPRLLGLDGADAAGLAGAGRGKGPDGLDDLVLVPAGKERGDGGEELVDLVRVLDGDLAVGDDKGDVDVALVLEAGEQAAQLAVDPADVEVGDNALEGEALDAGRVLDEAAAPLVEAALADLGQDIGPGGAAVGDLVVGRRSGCSPCARGRPRGSAAP